MNSTTLSSINPATGELLATLVSRTASEVNTAVTIARSFWPSWSATPVAERLKILRQFKSLLLERKQDLAKLITTEMGKPYVESLGNEVLVVLDAIHFLLNNAEACLSVQKVPHANLAMKFKKGMLLRQPYGVIGIISPWNYPLAIPAIQILSALVAGNVVVLKPSEYTSLTALELVKLFIQAGLPPQALQIIVGGRTTAEALIKADIDKLIFTGSVPAGKSVAQRAGERLLPTVLELGGKDAMIVLDDADIEVCSSAAIWGAFSNTGQACLSVERCYVQRSVYEQFVKSCAEKTSKLRCGNGLDPDIEVGPLLNEHFLQNVHKQVQEAIAAGARLLAGGQRLEHLGPNFYAPTVLADINPSMRIMREETFGPVLPIIPFDNEEDAIILSNSSDYGLAASVWTSSAIRGENIAKQLNVGSVMVNDVLSCFGISEAPHGGLKSSGIGRTHGLMGLNEMIHNKYIDIDRLPKLKKAWWYGYNKHYTKQMEAFIELLFAKGFWRILKGALGSAGMMFRRTRL